MAHVPPTLVRMEAPVLVEGPPELMAASRRHPGKATDPTLDDIVNSILPPRFVAECVLGVRRNWTSAGTLHLLFV
jgi:hypothetical protein